MQGMSEKREFRQRIRNSSLIRRTRRDCCYPVLFNLEVTKLYLNRKRAPDFSRKEKKRSLADRRFLYIAWSFQRHSQLKYLSVLSYLLLKEPPVLLPCLSLVFHISKFSK